MRGRAASGQARPVRDWRTPNRSSRRYGELLLTYERQQTVELMGEHPDLVAEHVAKVLSSGDAAPTSAT